METGIMLCMAVFSMSFQSIFAKMYEQKSGQKRLSQYAFVFLQLIASFAFFVVNLKQKFEMQWEVVPYAIFFAVFYFEAIFCNLRAIETGSMSLTNLVMSYSLIIPTMYGILFRKEHLSTWGVIGIILLAISLYFIGGGREKVILSKKWLLFISIAFLSNGFCTVTQKMYQIRSGGKYKSEFMILSLGMAIIAFACALVGKEKRLPIPRIRNGGHFAICAGLCGGMLNLFVMLLANTPSYIVYPTISGGSMVLTFIIARMFFHEKLSTAQNIGCIIGVTAVVLLNL